jgi:hypothetical protein
MEAVFSPSLDPLCVGRIRSTLDQLGNEGACEKAIDVVCRAASVSSTFT